MSWGAAGGLLLGRRWAAAGVEGSEAERLEGPLTPFGAEKAGNPDGSIPAWEGGYSKVPPGYRSGQPRPDLFPDDRPLYRITAANAAQHMDHLSEGLGAILQRFPTYRLDVYPTRRTSGAPPWVYENTFANATRARTRDDGLSVEGAYGGIPFPIPKTGAETMWNHVLSWRGEAGRYRYATYVVASGAPVLTSAGLLEAQSPYYDRTGTLERFGGMLGLIRVTVTAPRALVGGDLVVHDPVNPMKGGRRSWVRLVGQRRVRRTPTVSYDNPDRSTSGFSFVDEGYIFNGSLDRYEWKVLGKREMVVPYNTERFHLRPIAEVLGPQHPNPDHVRWERHRVWIVEATLAPGKRHAMPRRRFYLDEDSWLALLSDGWDARGRLWHVGHSLPFLVTELPATLAMPYIVFDLARGGYVGSSLFNETDHSFEVVPRRPEDYFSAAALEAGGVR